MLEQYIGREKDLEFLENCYKKTTHEAQLTILTGKIRVGKTYLLKKFYEKKPHIYFNISKGSATDQLETIVDYFTNEFEDTFLDKKSIPNWTKFFEYLGSKLAKVKIPLIIVFDEFQNLIESDSNFMSTFNIGWENCLQNKKLMLIMSGSTRNLLNKYALNSKSAISKRKITYWEINNFDFETSKKCFSINNFEKIFKLYTIVGGVPAYLNEISGKKSLRDNITKIFLDKSSYLSLESQLILAEEFQDPKIYLTILKAIGLGGQKYSSLIEKTGLSNNKLSSYLNNLIKTGLVKRLLPVTMLDPEKSKKGLYFITDSFLRCYFSFIFPYSTLIESKNFETLFKNHFNIIELLIATNYEEVSLEFVFKAIQQSKISSYDYIGKWWDNNNKISIVGFNQDNNQTLFVDTIWSSKEVGLKELQNLKNKAVNVKTKYDSTQVTYGLISNKGFSGELIKVAKQENILLIKGDTVVN